MTRAMQKTKGPIIIAAVAAVAILGKVLAKGGAAAIGLFAGRAAVQELRGPPEYLRAFNDGFKSTATAAQLDSLGRAMAGKTPMSRAL